MNQQEIFTKVVTHLRFQKAKSVDWDGCKYRSDSGLMCAVGCLIDDEFYSFRLETITVNSEIVRSALSDSGIDTDDVKTFTLLRDLQDIHDRHSVHEWETLFASTAMDYNLVVPPLNTGE